MLVVKKLKKFCVFINKPYIIGIKKIIDTIGTPGGKRLYNVKKYLENSKKNESNVTRVNNTLMIDKKINSLRNNYIYARVSSNNQKDDLIRQINELKLKYPNYKLISDIGKV
jgi:hypothetical protein